MAIDTKAPNPELPLEPEAPQVIAQEQPEPIQVAGRFKMPGISLRELQGRADAAPVEDADAILEATPVGRLIDPSRTETRNFGLNAIHTDEDIKGLIDGTSEIVFESYGPGSRYRTPQSHRATAARAADPTNEENISLETLLGQSPSTALNSTQLTRARMLMVQGAAELTESAKAIHNRESVDSEELWLFRRKVANYVALQRRVQGAVREAARTLNAMQIPVGANDLSMIDFDALIDNMGGKKASQKMAQLIVEAKGDPNRIAKIARGSWGARTWNAITEVWINGLLSAPSTHGLNFSGNLLNSGLAVAERYGAAMVGLLTRSAGKGGVTFTEANTMALAWLEGWKFAGKAFADALRYSDGDRPGGQLLDPTNRKASVLSRQPAVTAQQLGLDEQGALGKAVDYFGKWYVRLPSRFLEAEDEFFKAQAYVMELKARAVRTATDEGITDPKAFDARVNYILENPPADLHMNAQQFARYQTFTNSLEKSAYSGVVTNARMQKAVLDFSRTPVGRIFLPFVRTPTNIIKYGLQRSPFGLAMPSVWADLQRAGAPRDLAVARIAIGGVGLGLAWNWWNKYGTDEKGNTVHRPLITGAGPKSFAQRKAWELSGIQPYSIYVDGAYVSYNRFDPFGQQLGVVATALELMSQQYDDQPKEEWATALVMGMAEFYLDRSFMTGFNQLIDLLDVKKRSGESSLNAVSRWSSLFAASFVPNWIARSAVDVERFKNGNAVRRDPRSNSFMAELVNRAKARSPFFNEDVPPAVDMLGNHVPMLEPVVFMNALSPFSYSIARQDSELAIHIIENNVNDKTPTKSTINYQLSDDDKRSAKIDMYDIDPTGWFFHDYKQVLGQRRKSKLRIVVASRPFQDAPIGVRRAAAIEKALNEARQEVHDELFGGRSKKRARADVQKIRNKYRDELKDYLQTVRLEARDMTTNPVSLPPSMTYPMMP